MTIATELGETVVPVFESLSERELDTAYAMARESLWQQRNVSREQANAAARAVMGPAASVAQIVDVTNRVCDFMRGAGRLAVK